MSAYDEAVKEIKRSDCINARYINYRDYSYGVIGQIAVANAIKELTEEYKRHTSLMEGFYSVAVRVADTLEEIEINLGGLNEGVGIYHKY